MFALENDAFQCSKCLDRFPGRPEMLEKVRIQQGCIDPKSYVVHKIDDEIFYYRCPGNFFSRSVTSIMELWNSFQNGVLPFEGSLVDQPAKIMEIFGVLDRIKHDRMKKAQDEHDRKMKALNGRKQSHSIPRIS